jgi:hypothetical protein
MFNDNQTGSFSGTSMLEPMTVTIPVDFEAPAESMGPKIAANMAGVDLILRRPGGKYKIQNAEVLAADEHGVMEKMDKKKITNSAFITDSKADHPIWERIDENTQKFNTALKVYSVNDSRRGFHLVPMSKTGNLAGEFVILKQEREHWVDELTADYDTWIANLRAKFNGQFHLLLRSLPARESLRDKFAVTWIFMPLTPIDPSNLKFNDINDHDRQSIIDDSNKMAHDMIAQRARAIYDEAFGSVLDTCEKIVAGSLETGKRRFAAISEIIDSLNRLKNFSEWANPEVVSRANDALRVLNNIADISEVNQNDGQNQVTRAIVAAMKPLGDSVDRMLRQAQPGSSRASREIID